MIIPDSVTYIGGYAFADNCLTSVTIPDSVEAIANFICAENALPSAAFEGNFDTFSLDMFGDNDNLATITYAQGVPARTGDS